MRLQQRAMLVNVGLIFCWFRGYPLLAIVIAGVLCFAVVNFIFIFRFKNESKTKIQ